MPKFSSKQTRPNVTHPVRTTGERAHTEEGHLGHVRDAKSELFLLALSNMVSEQTFYESAQARDERFKALVHSVVAEDPNWLRRFGPFLRDEMQLRSAPVVLAAHAVAAKMPGSRQLVDSVLRRGDEPAEILAFYAQEYGKAFPKPLKRGVADAVRRLYTERSALRYDGTSRAWRMGDVLNLVHPKPRADWQRDLFCWLLDARYGHAGEIPDSLPTLGARAHLEALAPAERPSRLDPDTLARAGMSWEALSGWLQGPMDARAWEAVIPNMGYMALLRNLRNFEQAGVNDATLDAVAATLVERERVASSRQLPFRFYSAWKQLPSERFGWALERALDLSLANVPALPGRTLVLVDVSGSMRKQISRHSQVNWWEIATLFGAALGKRAEAADVVVYSTTAGRVDLSRSLLRIIEATGNWPDAFGGTQTFRALELGYSGHDRVVIVTDEQAHPYRHDPLGALACPVYTFNVVGYRVGHGPSGEKGRYVFGGLSDACFRMLPLLEAQQRGAWPF